MIKLEKILIIQLIDEINLYYNLSTKIKIQVLTNVLKKLGFKEEMNKFKLYRYYPQLVRKQIPTEVHNSIYDNPITNSILYELEPRTNYHFNQQEIKDIVHEELLNLLKPINK